MKTRPQRDTKIVWSIDSRGFDNEKALDAYKNKNIDSLRVVYRPEHIDKICSFLQTARSHADQTPIIVDVATEIPGVVTNLDNPIELEFGQKIEIGLNNEIGDFALRGESINSYIKEGSEIIVGHGYAELKVLSFAKDKVGCEVIQGGMAYENMVVHIPSTRDEADPSKLKKDDLNRILESGADALLIPGYTKAENIKKLKAMIDDRYSPHYFVKVDHQSTVEMLDSILSEVHGVVIARLDLALTTSATSIPVVSKKIMKLCIERAKTIITASEMLSSMQRNPSPTRAEVSDIANAVLDSTDAVMLSEDVANGKYGDLAVEAMSATIIDAEAQPRSFDGWDAVMPELNDPEVDSISFAAYRTAERVGAKAIVCLTKGGIQPLD